MEPMTCEAPITVTREDLYEKVWTTPLSRLAPQFGLSDTGLKKICARMQIPTPSRGYWNKLADGGTIIMPLAQAPWGDSFGMLTDKFGTPWLVNIAGARPAA